MKLEDLKQEIFLLISQNNININEIDIQLSRKFDNKYTIVINKIKKLQIIQDSFFISGYICRELQENIMEDDFIFLGKTFIRNNYEGSFIKFYDTLYIMDNTESLYEPNYYKYNFKGRFLMKSPKYYAKNYDIQETIFKHDKSLYQ